MSASTTYGWQLRYAFAQCWAQDRTFRRALVGFYARHCRTLPDALAAPIRRPLVGEQPAFAEIELTAVDELTWQTDDTVPDGFEWAIAYLSGLSSFAARYGLDRWQPRGPDRDHSFGETVIHRWCALRAGYGYSPDFLPLGVGAEAYFVPDRTRTIELTWDPRDESYEAARRRWRGAVDRELAYIRERWDAAGFRVRAPGNAGRDLAWLYQRVRFGRTVPEIVALEGWDADSVDLVQKATKKLATKLGVELS